MILRKGHKGYDLAPVYVHTPSHEQGNPEYERSEDQPNLNSKLDDDGTNGDHGNQYKSSGTHRFPQ